MSRISGIEKLARIGQSGVIAIIRASSSDELIAVADAIREGGVRAIEVTMTTPGALQVIESAVTRFGNEVMFGAGTVLDSETARAALSAGAGFVVAPTLDIDTIAFCNRYDVPVLPGVFTPTEALAAVRAGAGMVKLFPAEVGGPGMVSAILAPLPQLRIVPVGGVDLSNAAAFIRSGAVAIGVGSSLCNKELIDSRNFPEITRRSGAFIAAVQEGRSLRKSS